MSKLQFWKKTIFWEMTRNSLTIFGMPSGAVAAYMEVNPKYLIVSAVSAVAIGLISIWMVDHNKNRIVDLFEDK